MQRKTRQMLTHLLFQNLLPMGSAPKADYSVSPEEMLLDSTIAWPNRAGNDRSCWRHACARHQ